MLLPHLRHLQHLQLRTIVLTNLTIIINIIIHIIHSYYSGFRIFRLAFGTLVRIVGGSFCLPTLQDPPAQIAKRRRVDEETMERSINVSFFLMFHMFENIENILFLVLV